MYTKRLRVQAAAATVSFVVSMVGAPETAPAYSAPSVPGIPAGVAPPGQAKGAGPQAPSVKPAVSAKTIASQGAAPAKIVLPRAEKASVRLDGIDVVHRAGQSPVSVAAQTAGVSGASVDVEVLDPSATQRAGRSGFLFRISGPAGKVKVAVDYSGFANGFGGGYADRLRLVALPACVLSGVTSQDCDRIGKQLPARNDRAASRLTLDGLVTSPDTVFAVTAAPSGEGGDYRATPFEATSDWEVGIGSGEFAWNYPVLVPAPPAGVAPNVALRYSSGAIDGLTSTRNTQAGAAGLGFGDFADAFVERRYITCSNDSGLRNVLDLCWQSDNAMISLNGHAAELIPANRSLPPTQAKEWRLASDPRWKVEQLFGAAGDPSNGDNDKEWWKVTTPDGVEHWFGRGYNPDAPAQATKSVFTVPVFGNQTGEPCGTLCVQGWRWNLDRIVDPNGNVATYTYSQEANKYLGIAGLAGEQTYVRGGQLATIEYGAHTGPAVTAQAKVEFVSPWRCASLADTLPPTTGACQEPKTGADPAQYPDVPVDLICVANTSGCTNVSPTFFSARRYAFARTFSLVSGVWKPVDEFKFAHTYKANPAGDKKMYLASVQRKGLTAATSITLPPAALSYVELENRVTTATNKQPHFRLSQVLDEYGARVSVTYGQPHACPNDQAPAQGWDNNPYDCFRQQWTPDGDPVPPPVWGVFRKWLVTQIKVEDTTTASPAMTTSYVYEGTPAWHFDTDRFITTTNQGWEDWRGYDTVVASTGLSRTRYRVLRGMHGDRLASGATRTVDVASLDDPALKHKDWNWLAGSIFDQAQLSNATPPVTMSGVVKTYRVATTVDDDTNTANDPHAEKAAVWTGEETTTERLRKPDGTYAKRRTTTGYNALVLFPETTEESGWLDVTGDERCTRTAYTLNVAKWMLDIPASVRLQNGACAANGTELRMTETAYDGGAYGASPVRGNITKQRTKLTATPTWAETTTTFDSLGRPVSTVDPMAHKTTVAFSPATGNANTITTTMLAHLADTAKWHTSTTTMFVERSAPSKQVNPNGKTATFGYDALGRSIWVRQPTEQAAGEPNSYEFSYTIDPNKAGPPVIRTRRLQSTNPTVFQDSWAIYDSVLRTRQSHALSPVTGKVIVVNTDYDDRGLAASVTKPQAITGTPGAGILKPAGTPPEWENRTTTAYDELQRPIWEIYWANPPGAEAETYQWSKFTTYTHESSTAIRDRGGDVASFFDAYRRLIRVEEQATRGTWTGKAVMKYTYNAANDQMSITDPANRVMTYTYDLAGRRTSMVDPDAGRWDYAYDAVGNQTMIKDSRPSNNVTYTAYDGLNRPIERRETNPTTGRVLATWAYDAPGQKGLLDSAISFHRRPNGEGDEAFIVDVTGYDDRSRETGKTLTVFADRGGLFGSYQFGYIYDRADHVVVRGLPQINDANGQLVLPAELLVTEYNNLGQVTKVTGLHDSTSDTYLHGATYDEKARPLWFGYGQATGGTWKIWGYDKAGRLSSTTMIAGIQTSGQSLLQSRALSYDQTQNVTRRVTTLDGKTWTDCYGFDDRNQLRRAYSTSQAAACDAASAGTGDNPYDESYSYSLDGNLTGRVEGASSSNPRTYTYAYDATQPHATDSVDSSVSGQDVTYAWDAAGQMSKRQRSGGDFDTFVWTSDRLLDRIQDPNGNTRDSMAYGPDRQRVLRENVDRTTIFVEGHEIAASGGGGVTAVRTYRVDNDVIATRTRDTSSATPTLEYLTSDNMGSVELTVKDGENTPSASRVYSPYGQHTGGEFLTDQGYIGQIEDDRTNLNYLNNRYYDPFLARFTSTDPLADPNSPRTANPYAYSRNNPVTFRDPSGLCTVVGNTLYCGGGVTVEFEYPDGSKGAKLYPSDRQRAVNKFNDDIEDGNFDARDYSRKQLEAIVADPGAAGWLLEHGVVPLMATFDDPCTDSVVTAPCPLVTEHGYNYREIFFEWLDSEVKPAAMITLVALTFWITGDLHANELADDTDEIADHTIVLGKYPDYLNLAEDLNAETFNIPDELWEELSATEQWALNKAFIDVAVDNGAVIRLSNSVYDPETFTGAYAREINYLMYVHDYHPSADGMEMLPPGVEG